MAATSDWVSKFPAFGKLTPEALAPVVENSVVLSLKAGSRIFGPGLAPASFLLLIEGTVRVQQISETGREIVLYRVEAGESCPLTMACLMGYEDYLAEAVAEGHVIAVAVPRAVFDELVARSADFRHILFSAFSKRVGNLFRVIDDVAFSRIDIRLAQKLLQISRGADRIDISHQQLASEIGTAREVVSRVLSDLQRRGLITSLRGSISFTDRNALERLANDH